MWATNSDEVIDKSIRAGRNEWGHKVYLAVFGKLVENNRRVVLSSGLFVPVEESEMWQPKEWFYLEQAQVLMDDLWHCGLRPSATAGSAGAMDTVQEHLKQLKEENEWLKAKVDQLLQEKNDGTR